jgi:ABC-type nitrate/sulfonate/bicarbonate transport system substrate-binding protein
MKKILYIFSVILISISTACHAATEVRILRQPGQISNMPLLYETIKHFQRLAAEKNIDIEVKLQPLGNVSDGVTSMLAGHTDIIMGSVIPFFLANDKVPNKLLLLSGSSSHRYFMVCKDYNIRTEEDLIKAKKIAVKTWGSGEQFYVQQISKRISNEYTTLDKKIIVMPRNQILSAMQSRDKDIDCAVPGSPGQGTLIKQGHVHVVRESVHGTLGNIHGTFTTRRWAMENPMLIELWKQSLVAAVLEMNKDQTGALKIFKNIDNNLDSIEDLIDVLRESEQVYSTDTTLIEQQRELLIQMGLIKK